MSRIRREAEEAKAMLQRAHDANVALAQEVKRLQGVVDALQKQKPEQEQKPSG